MRMNFIRIWNVHLVTELRLEQSFSFHFFVLSYSLLMIIIDIRENIYTKLLAKLFRGKIR